MYKDIKGEEACRLEQKEAKRRKEKEKEERERGERRRRKKESFGVAFVLPRGTSRKLKCYSSIQGDFLKSLFMKP